MTEQANRPPRDRHPARSARIIATGISVSGLVSLVTAFNVQALRQTAAAEDTAEVVDTVPATFLAPLDQATTTKAPSTPQSAVAVAPRSSIETVVTPVVDATGTGAQPTPSRVVLEIPATPAPAPSAVSSGSQ